MIAAGLIVAAQVGSSLGPFSEKAYQAAEQEQSGRHAPPLVQNLLAN